MYDLTTSSADGGPGRPLPGVAGGWRTRVLIGLTLLAALLVAAVPLALLAGLFLMLFGHVIGGLALFGGSILVAGAAVTVAAATGVRQLRRLLRQHATRVIQLGRGDYRYE